MSNLTLKGNASGSGTFIVESPNSNTSRTITLPDATTTLVGTDATQTLTNKTIQGGALTLMTAQASTSGTVIDFTGIPSWVRRITVMLNAVSTNGSSAVIFQLGTSGGLQTTGYDGRTVFIQASSVGTQGAITSGFTTTSVGPAAVLSGSVVFNLFGSNAWLASGVLLTSASLVSTVSGIVTLSGVLDRARVTTVNGTDTFDAGTINIMYEG